jgi:rhodanese-related sulfurtransferase
VYELREVSPQQFKALAEEDGAVTLLDIREEWELALASVAGATHMPMGQVPDRMTELKSEETIVVMCHHGSRSATVAGFLMRNGFTRVLNLTGGIDAWARDLDPNVPSY